MIMSNAATLDSARTLYSALRAAARWAEANHVYAAIAQVCSAEKAMRATIGSSKSVKAKRQNALHAACQNLASVCESVSL